MNPATGKPRARPDCAACKRLVVRVRCDDCGKKLCHECSKPRPDTEQHACFDCFDQLLFPFAMQA